ncbi:MAG: helix-turn-helix domain-containing protein [Lachnospiraceae bacterium]
MYRGLTLTELAKRTEISKQSISLYENDNNTPDYWKLTLGMKLTFRMILFQRIVMLQKQKQPIFVHWQVLQRKIERAQSIKLEYVAKMYEILLEFISFPEMNLPNVNFVGCDDVFECENEDANSRNGGYCCSGKNIGILVLDQ